jgi:hypothetical protein
MLLYHKKLRRSVFSQRRSRLLGCDGVYFAVRCFVSWMCTLTAVYIRDTRTARLTHALSQLHGFEK